MNLINELLQLCIEKSENTDYNIHFDWFSNINTVYVWASSENVDLYLLPTAGVNNAEEMALLIKEVKELV